MLPPLPPLVPALVDPFCPFEAVDPPNDRGPVLAAEPLAPLEPEAGIVVLHPAARANRGRQEEKVQGCAGAACAKSKRNCRGRAGMRRPPN